MAPGIERQTGKGIGEDSTLLLTVGEFVDDGVPEGDCVTVPKSEPLSEGVGVGVAVTLGLPLTVSDADGDPVPVGVPELVCVGVFVGVLEPLLPTVSVFRRLTTVL